uniref:C-type lectin domain-containing protein n=1 Tax=Caenorhabditis japonica TaxID=281687 RepID=A0A8R1IJ41_CAEJA
MVSCKLLLSLLALVAVAQAIIRPGYGYGYGGGGGKNHPKTKKPTPAPTTTPVPVESTTLKMTPACEPGYTLYKRGSGYWCMKVVRGVNVTVSEAAALCTAERSVLTNYENEAERLAVSGNNYLYKNIYDKKNRELKNSTKTQKESKM